MWQSSAIMLVGSSYFIMLRRKTSHIISRFNMNSMIFWNILPYISCKIKSHDKQRYTLFGEMCQIWEVLIISSYMYIYFLILYGFIYFQVEGDKKVKRGRKKRGIKVSHTSPYEKEDTSERTCPICHRVLNYASSMAGQ